MCRQIQIEYIPIVINRPKRPTTPIPAESTKDTATTKLKLQASTITMATLGKRATQTSNLDSFSATQSDFLLQTSISQKQNSFGFLNEQTDELNKDKGKKIIYKINLIR